MSARERRTDCVVPFAVKAMSCEPHGSHLRVSDGDPARIAASIDLRADTQSRPTMRGTNQVHDGGQIDEGGAAPVHGDVREEAMFNTVPLAGPRREVTDSDRQARAIREPLQFPLPEPKPCAVAAAGVGGDQERPRLRVGGPPMRCHHRRIAFTAKLAVS